VVTTAIRTDNGSRCEGRGDRRRALQVLSGAWHDSSQGEINFYDDVSTIGGLRFA